MLEAAMGLMTLFSTMWVVEVVVLVVMVTVRRRVTMVCGGFWEFGWFLPLLICLIKVFGMLLLVVCNGDSDAGDGGTDCDGVSDDGKMMVVVQVPVVR